jgi:hypothetical protein
MTRSKPPRKGEAFHQFSHADIFGIYKFRVYTLPSEGLMELEEMDSGGEMIDCIISHTVGVFGFTQEYKERIVDNMKRLLNFWYILNFYKSGKRSRVDIDRETAIVAFEAMVELAKAMSPKS